MGTALLRDRTSSTEYKRALRGARWMDEQAPGWEAKIDPGKLNISSNRSCILGQVWGGFYRASARYDLGEEQAEDLGVLNRTEDPDEYPRLTSAWQGVLRARAAFANAN